LGSAIAFPAGSSGARPPNVFWCKEEEEEEEQKEQEQEEEEQEEDL